MHDDCTNTDYSLMRLLMNCNMKLHVGNTLCLQVNTLDEHEWHRLEQAHVLANVQQAFNDGGAAGTDLTSEDVDDAMFASGDMLSPSLAPAGSTDAHTMALILQQQLDAINNEIRCEATNMK